MSTLAPAIGDSAGGEPADLADDDWVALDARRPARDDSCGVDLITRAGS